jgi:hypothetical protein
VTVLAEFLLKVAKLASGYPDAVIAWRETTSQHFLSTRPLPGPSKFPVSYDEARDEHELQGFKREHLKCAAAPAPESTYYGELKRRHWDDARTAKVAPVRFIDTHDIFGPRFDLHVGPKTYDCTHYCYAPTLANALFRRTAHVLSQGP